MGMKTSNNAIKSFATLTRTLRSCAAPRRLLRRYMNIRKLVLIFCLIIFQTAIGQPDNAKDLAERFHKKVQWESNWLSELTSADEPWIWALSLHSLSNLTRDREFRRTETKKVIDKLLAHASPSAESLYWAALYCRSVSNLEHVCRTRELVKRLMEVDGDNLYSLAIYFETEISDKTGIGKTSSEFWNWSYFDSWLERAATLDRAENYDFLHYTAMFKMLLEYAQTQGVYSYLTDAPLEWRVAYSIIDDLVYPWHGSMMEVKSHCQMSEYLGRQKATLACRDLANKLLENSNSIWSRSDALDFLAETYSRNEPEFIRLKRESAVWSSTVGAVKKCINRFHDYAHKEWTVNYDVNLFVHEYESKGEIFAFQNLAESENWTFKDDASIEYKCTEIPAMPDEELSKILGMQDPAWEWCRDGEYCDRPSPHDP
jgi:hypothetical protein